MNKLKSKIFKLIEANSVDIEESSKNGIIAHYVDVDELVDDLFSLYDVSQQSELLKVLEYTRQIKNNPKDIQLIVDKLYVENL